MMEEINALLVQYGLWFVFFNIFLEQAGLPVPAVPTLLAAGAITVSGGPALSMVILVAVAGSLLGDLLWYAAGRLYGMRVLRFLCRISISPDSCVRQTETRFNRWGAPSLLFAKFIPGFATVAPPVAGALRVPLGPFLAYSTLSAALYAGIAAGTGVFFSREIDWVIGKLEAMGVYALVLLGCALALFIALKWWERRRFFMQLRMARVSVDDLYKMMQIGEAPVVVDVRSASAREIDPRRVPGSIAVDMHDLDAHVAQLPPDRDIIVYCT